MGSTVQLHGRFKIEPPLNKDQVDYLKQFANSRRMKRDPLKVKALHDPLREAVGLPVGVEGEYYVGHPDYADSEVGVTDFNREPGDQPDVWCGWTAFEDGTHLVDTGCDKFPHFEPWLVYMIKHFFEPWGKTLNGSVLWSIQYGKYTGILKVQDNVVSNVDGTDAKI
jgi:hypothetical protein